MTDTLAHKCIHCAQPMDPEHSELAAHPGNCPPWATMGDLLPGDRFRCRRNGLWRRVVMVAWDVHTGDRGRRVVHTTNQQWPNPVGPVLVSGFADHVVERLPAERDVMRITFNHGECANGVPSFHVVGTTSAGETLDIATYTLTGASRLSHFVRRGDDAAAFMAWRRGITTAQRDSLTARFVAALEAAADHREGRRTS